MRFDVLTLFPEVIESYCNVSIMKRARDNGVISINTVNPRNFTLDKHKKVDDTPLNESLVLELTNYNQIILLCGHYEGFDERIREIIKPREISLGDFVLTGGELPALCLIDAVSRKLDGTLGKLESAMEDSFSNGLLEYPHYTKPRDFRGYKVPEVLLNGNHKEIGEYRFQEQLNRTKRKRPDLYEKYLENKDNK